MIPIAGDPVYIDPGVLDIVVKGVYFRELHGSYFMNVGRVMLELLEAEKNG